MKSKEKKHKKKKLKGNGLIIADPAMPIVAATNGTPPLEIHHGDVKAEARKIKNEVYEKELARLQIELVKMQNWIKHKGLKVLVHLRRARRGRQGRRHQTHHREPQSAHLPSGRSRHADRTRKDINGTFSAMWPNCRPPANWSCSTAVGTTAPASSA